MTDESDFSTKRWYPELPLSEKLLKVVEERKQRRLLASVDEPGAACPCCGSGNIYGISRVVGYYSVIDNWNRSKKAELKARQKGNYWLVKEEQELLPVNCFVCEFADSNETWQKEEICFCTVERKKKLHISKCSCPNLYFEKQKVITN